MLDNTAESLTFLRWSIEAPVLGGGLNVVANRVCACTCVRDLERGMKVDSIGGFDARGFILGPPVALALNIPFFMLRKKVRIWEHRVEREGTRPSCPPRDGSSFHGDGNRFDIEALFVRHSVSCA